MLSDILPKNNQLDIDKLRHIKKDIDGIPDCSEKITLKLIYNVSMYLNRQGSVLINLPEEVENLIERLKVEQLFSEKIKKILDEIKVCSSNKILDLSKKLILNIRDLDVQELIRLIKINKNDLELIKNKNIYILIGLADDGKSTTLQFMSGSKMKNNIEASQRGNPYSASVRSKVLMKPETRNIPVKFFEKEKFIISENSNSPEVEIANVITIRKKIEACSGIKPIIVVSKLMGDRFQLLPVLAQVLAGMIPSIKDKHLLSYLYTNFKPEELESARTTLLNIKKELEENQVKSDSSFKEIIEDICLKSENKMVIWDSINGNSNDVLSSICDGKFIQNPSRNFNVPFSFNTKQKVEKQIEKHFNSIEKSILRNEFEFAFYKLNEAIELKNIIKQSDIDDKFIDAGNFLIKSLDKEYASKLSYFNRKIEMNELLNEQDLSECLICFDNAKKSDEIIRKLNYSYNKHAELKHDFLKKINQIVSDLNEKNINHQKIDLDNLKLISVYFQTKLSIYNNDNEPMLSHLSTKYQEACTYLNTNLNKNVDLNNNNDFNKIAKEMRNLEELNELFKDHLKELSLIYEKTKDSLIQLFKFKADQAKDLAKNDQNIKDFYKVLDDNDLYFNSALNNPDLHRHVSLEIINKCYKVFLNEIKTFIQGLQTIILKDINRNTFSSIKCCFKSFIMFRNNDNFRKEIDQIYQETLNSLIHMIKAKKTEIISIVNNFSRSQLLSLNSKYLIKKIRVLKDLEWIDKYRTSFVKNTITKIQMKINDHFGVLEKSLVDKSIKIEESTEINEVYKIIKKMVSYEPLALEFNDELVSLRIVSKKEWFKNSINSQLEFIILACSSDSVNYELMENSIIFIQNCEKIDFFNLDPKFQMSKDKISEFLYKKKTLIETSLKECFEFIENSNESNDFFDSLNELQHVQKNYPNCFKSFDENILEDWRKKLLEKYKNIESSSLLVVKHLVKLDEFLKNDECSFKSLFSENSIGLIQKEKLELDFAALVTSFNALRKSIQEFETKYTIEDFHDYPPKDIYIKLSSFNDESIKEIQLFENTLIESFKTELSQTKLFNSKNNQSVQKCRKYLHYLPDGLVKQVKIMIEEAELNLDRKNLADKNIDEFIEKFSKLDLLFSQFSSGFKHEEDYKKYKDELNKMHQESYSKIEELILIKKENSSVNNVLNTAMVKLHNDFPQLVKNINLNSIVFISHSLDVTMAFDLIAGSEQPNSELIPIEEMKLLLRTEIERLSTSFQKLELIKISRNKFQAKFDAFFDNIYKDLSLIKTIESSFKKYIPDLNNQSNCIEHLKNKIDCLFTSTDHCLDKILNGSSILAEGSDSDLFFSGYYNLNAFKKNMPSFEINFESIFQEKVCKKVQSLFSSIEQKSLNEACEIFVSAKELSDRFFIFKEKIDTKLESAISLFILTNNGFRTMEKLALILQKSTTGSIIISEHKIFDAYKISIFNQKISEQSIQDILKELELMNNDVEKSELEIHYTEFKNRFDELMPMFLESVIKLEEFKSSLITLAKQIQIEKKEWKIVWNDTIKKKIPNLIAHVFALWMYLNAQDFLKSNYKDKKYFFQPHPAQVISIFRMLGIGYKEACLSNHLVQIGSGEGKSGVFAITAVVLSLLDFDVYCACSIKDHNAFKVLFNELKLTELIRFETLEKICEEFLNEQGDLRNIVTDFILSDKLEISKNSESSRPRILLIDEVDVFFSKHFNGNNYKPVVNLRDPTVTKLIDCIWSQRKNDIKFLNLIETKEFQNCCDKFSNCKELVAEAVKEMISALKTFETHEYFVEEDQIGYKEQDEIVFFIWHGYQTLFAYYLEHERGNISTASLDDNISLIIRLGAFSFAEITLNHFSSILGVTRTLETLSPIKKEIIKHDYGIKLQTLIPSVFGENKLKFDEKDDLKVEDEENYFKVLQQEIKRRIIGKDSTERAVFVFFESKEELYNFYDHEEYSSLANTTTILTEEANVQERAQIIKNAVKSGKITFFSNVFGKGTDFVAHDEIVIKNGGVHVIQSFLSEDLTEEMEIRDRTARYGQDGSFSLIILDKSLEKYNVFRDDIINNSNNLYNYLNEKRNYFFDNLYEKNSEIKQKHDLSIKFIDSVLNKDTNAIKEFILTENTLL